MGETVQTDKRKLFASAAFGIAGYLGLRSGHLERRPDADLIRPPGSLQELDFLEICIRCGECMKVCPTNFLQMDFNLFRPEALFTPVGNAELGFCDFMCNACGDVCPTGAIQKLTLEHKQKQPIGLAFINRNRCLPWSYNKPCIVCEEMCPTSPKSIWCKTVQLEDRNGQLIELMQPFVDPDRCIGCGICENWCPMVDEPAIKVHSIQESRSPYNQVFQKKESND